VLLIIVFFLFKGGTIIKNIFYPAKPTPPTVGFGKLPSIEFPTSKYIKTYNYSLDTLTGEYPEFPDKIKVFQMTPNEGDLLALKKTQDKLTRISFYSSPIKISKDVYKWNDGSKIMREITFNLLTSDFILTSSYLSDPSVLKALNLPDSENAKAIAQAFLDNMDSFPKDIDTTRTQAYLYAINGNQLVPSSSLSGSQVVQVHFFQSDVDKKKIYYSTPGESMIYLSVASGDYGPQIVTVNFSHQNISDKSETYPLKSAKEAWDQLKSGGGYIAQYNGTDENISVKNISLGYFVGEGKQGYLMPIIVFEGEDNFVAYISAVKDGWLNN
ncbi:hypothetical protein M1307_00250, partial [Patescibacteria group bacterium]|nr:hypothetical protein [Patescibacteria group bacterium]